MGITFENSKGTPYSKLKSSQSETLDFTGQELFILKLNKMSRAKPMETNVSSGTNNLCSARRDMNDNSCFFSYSPTVSRQYEKTRIKDLSSNC